jgi:hypothetical protein
MKLCKAWIFFSTFSTNARMAAEGMPCDSGVLRGKIDSEII